MSQTLRSPSVVRAAHLDGGHALSVIGKIGNVASVVCSDLWHSRENRVALVGVKAVGELSVKAVAKKRGMGNL